MRTALVPIAVLLTGLTATLAGCGDSDPSGPAVADDRPAAVRSVAALGRAVVDEPAPPSVPDVFQCLVQGEVIVQGPYDRRPADGVTVATLSVSVTDRDEATPNPGAVYLFPDAGAAAAYSEAVRTLAVEDEGLDPATAVAAPHGSAVLVTDRALVPTAQEQALLGCLPDADPATVVAPPAPGTVSLGSLLSCGLAAGLGVRGEHTYVDELEGRLGTVTFSTPDGFGGSHDEGRVFVFGDADAAAAAEPGVVDGEPERHVRRGNTVTELPGPVDPADAETAAVLACLPA